jgi:tripartite-type tricarboxylate transporter receptor subunit TctC
VFQPLRQKGHGHSKNLKIGAIDMFSLSRRSMVSGLMAAGFGRPARAQQGKAVRLVVPAAPGGAIDAIGRLYAGRLKELLGQSWVIENRAGANNTLGAAEVARAPADGATLLTNADIQLMAKHVMRAVPYDPVGDFTPISRFATAPMVFVGNPGKTPLTLAELATDLKEKPDRHTFSNSGLGSMGHLATESFKKRAGVKTLVVSYRGTAPAITDVLAGVTTLMIAPAGSAQPHIAAGTLRAFAVMSERQTPLLPSTPTIADAGFPGLLFALWYGLWGPKGLSADVVAAINAAVQALSKEAEIIQRLSLLGADPVTETAEAFGRFLAQEVTRSAEIVKDAGIQPEG